jgi:glycosyltransferase involved in cell wall biosynthesis
VPETEPHRIHVLHLGSPTGLYGAERWILALVKHLPRHLVESWVAVIKDSPELEAPLCKHAAQDGLRTYVFESHGRLSLSAVGQVRRFIRENAIDILHTHGYKTDVIGCLATTGTRCRNLATPHGWNVKAGVKLKLYEALDRLCFYLMDAIAPLSLDLHRGLSRLPGLARKLHLIENGMDLSEIELATQLPQQFHQWRADGGIVIGYVGQLTPRKRIDTLIDAFHRLELDRKYLCIVGDGPQRNRLEQLATALGEAARITFFGYRDDRVALLKGFDLFVLPSELEGIPRCLMEAMAAGVPVVASDIPGCRDLIETGVTGLLFPPGNPSELARQMMHLIASPGLRTKFVDAGRQRMHDTRSAAAMARSYLTLYERLIKQDGIKANT